MSNETPIRILVLAGETSGDMYGAAILRELRAIAPRPLECYGLGGDQMKAEGVELFAHASVTGVMGFWEVLKRYRYFSRLLKTITGLLDTRRPDIVLTIDYPGFNMRIAEQAHRRGIRTVHYVCPQVWVWHRERIPKIARIFDRLIALFPFEPTLFDGTGLNITFEGHPLADQVAATLAEPPPDLPWGEGRRIALFPGSRPAEVARLLPVEIEAACRLEAAAGPCSFIIPAPTPSTRRAVEAILAKLPRKPATLAVSDGQSRHILRQAEAAVIKSGTSTLEASLLLCPCVIVYKVSPLTFAIGRRLVKGVSHVGLVNILAKRTVCRELIQDDMTPETVAAEMTRILSDDDYRNTMLEGMREVNAQVGPPGATARAAKQILLEIPGQGRRKPPC
ncbi:MAG: lipid-A-disaccharide synthase [Kiritimatiellia bacterium]|jgi:lipid-A-disaccharide synthase